jgi:peroxiredoxin
MKSLFSLFAFVVLCLVSACSSSENGVARGEIAPDFNTIDVNGKPYQLSSYKGKLVLLYFWADFCPTCQKEFPATQAYYSKLNKDKFELLAINVGQPSIASIKFKEKYKVDFPMLLDTTGQISKMYQADKLPTNYFISPEGKVIRRINGWIDENQVNVMIKQNIDNQ